MLLALVALGVCDGAFCGGAGGGGERPSLQNVQSVNEPLGKKLMEVMVEARMWYRPLHLYRTRKSLPNTSIRSSSLHS